MRNFFPLSSICFSLLFISSIESNAQWIKTNGPYGGTVTAMVAIPDTQTGSVDIFATTHGGGFYCSFDNGMQWHEVYTGFKNNPTIQYLTALSDSEGASTLYVGTTSGLYCTSDGGKTWKSLGALFEGYDVCPVAAYIDKARDTVLLAGVIPSLFVSTDAGRNWVSPTTPPVSHTSSFAVMPATKDSGIIRIIAGTTSDGVYISNDNGMNWTPSSLRGSIMALGTSDSVIYAGANDHIYRSTDEGASWTACSIGLPPATVVNAFAFIPNKSGSPSVVASTFGEIFLSTDNGDHWHAIKNNLWAGQFWSLTAAKLSLDTSAIFAGTESGVFRSTNTGLTWDIVNQGLSACVVTALGVSDSSLFAGTCGNGIFRSRDRGASWFPVNNGLDTAFIESIQTFGGLTVQAIGSFGNTLLAGTLSGIFRSTDDGANWTDVNNDWTRQEIWSFTKSDSSIFAGSSVFFVFRSRDDGITWNCGDTNFSLGGKVGNIMSLAFGNDKLFAAAMERGVYRSTDDGLSWTNIYSSERLDAYSLAYASPYLLLGISTGGLLISSNHGETWRDGVGGLPADDIYDFVFSGSNVFAGTFNGVFLSTDYGLQWRNVSSNELNMAVRSLVISNSNLFAGTEGAGVIWQRPISEMIVPTSVSTRPRTSDYGLDQNYPNPFNPTTVIRYQLATKNHVTLRIFDVLGREIALLVNEQKKAGMHSVSFNASNLPSGVYFYRLEAGTYHETKKLLIFK
jgi:photosystem II stability/assembly factor-like uncharacterized protein